MQELEFISGIAVVALYVALIALVIYLIRAIKRIVSAIDNINSTIDNIESKVDHITTKTEPLIENSLLITNDIKEISSNLKIQSAKINGIVDTVKDTTDSIVNFEQKVQKEVETNVFDALNMVSALSKGIKSFLNVLSGSRNGSENKKRIKTYETEDELY
ncbi:MAG TPA: DUF948 domain-containing protein [Ignavibacteria bacterium]|nr:DUF948 domain-containing protein [Ignavibacteria bacterium]HMQ97810.1 DUF948 domain-containing protein [Ignavibacteria bacterium]